MIQAVSNDAQKQCFLDAARREPMLHALLGRDLTLWADNPGAPVKLFVAGQAALSLTDDYAWLAGRPDDLEELVGFLRFAGVHTLQTPSELGGQPGLRAAGQDAFLVLEPGGSLPQPPLPQGFAPDTDVPVGEAAGLLFPTASAYRDGFYSRTATAVNHGLARLWGLRDAGGRLAASMGADALFERQAYLSLLHTDPAFRRRDLGGWLVTAMANALAAEGWRCAFFSEPHNLPFYRQLGFAPAGTMNCWHVEEQNVSPVRKIEKG